MTDYCSYQHPICTPNPKHSFPNKPPKITPEQVMELDDVVRAVVVKFLAQVHDQPQKNYCFETCENWVYEHVDHALASEIVTRNASCCHNLFEWVRDNGLGAWDELREENPDQYTPADMFQSAVASWLHDLIGAPEPSWA